jgi:hypothetical protein
MEVPLKLNPRFKVGDIIIYGSGTTGTHGLWRVNDVTEETGWYTIKRFNWILPTKPTLATIDHVDQYFILYEGPSQ